MDEDWTSLGTLGVMEPTAPPTAPFAEPPRQLPPPPPHTTPVKSGTWWRPALVGGLVGAVVATAVSLSVVNLTDEPSTRTVIREQVPSSGTVQTAQSGGLDVGAVLDVVSPSVISIEVGESFGQGQFAREGAGSGFIISADGLAITNAHVVAGATDLRVRLFDGQIRDAVLIGSSTADDLALIDIGGAADLTPSVLADSDLLKVGDDVVAIGNALALGEEPTVTRGIVSAKNRTLDEGQGGGVIDGVIQTDAAINPGNSGGPLVDSSGAVVGVNTAIIVDSQNVGFSIPINTVKALLPQLEQGNGGEIEVRRTFLGVSTAAVSELDPQALAELGITGDNGAVITRVEPGSAADSAGLVAGDVIISIDGEAVSTPSELRQRIRAHEPGDEVDLEVQRSGTTETLAAILGES